MAGIVRRSVGNSVASDIKENKSDESTTPSGANVPTNFATTVSTGSTLLDLAISGGRLERGGIPGGIIVEIFGPSGAGKSALLSELSASTQSRGGKVKFLDPEARLDKAYTEIYGVNIKEDFEYARPDTVSGMFVDEIWNWDTPNKDVINMIAADSLAALSTNMEMDNDDGDKMGMRRAKEFSEGLRKTCRLIAQNNWLIAMSNQIRMGEGGKVTTPGGHGVPFYASLRMQIKPGYPTSKIVKKKKMGKTEVSKVLGILSEVTIVKSSVDDPWRTAPLSIIFGYGIDTIRDELQYYKDLTGETTYNCFDKTYAAMDPAIAFIEDNGFKRKLQDRTIGLWNEVQDKFKTNRRVKDRR
jgi:recombination protein RecA